MFRRTKEEKARSKELNKMVFWFLWNTGILPTYIVIMILLLVFIIGFGTMSTHGR